MIRRTARLQSLMGGILIALLMTISAIPVFAQDTAWLRFQPGEEQWQGQLQTVISSYGNEAGITVNLVAAVHIADIEYYQQLNDYFLTQDAVLYELVAESDDRPTPEIGNNGSALSLVQTALAKFLGVNFQLQHIDYRAQNFVHADLSPSELQKIMRERNENFFSMFLNLATAQMAMSANTDAGSSTSSFTTLSIMNALSADDQVSAFKYLLAEELGRSQGVVLDADVEAQVTLLGERNRVALDVLSTTLTQRTAQSISIFYGAAHMPGIERELISTLGFAKRDQQWLTAWNIP